MNMKQLQVWADEAASREEMVELITLLRSKLRVTCMEVGAMMAEQLDIRPQALTRLIMLRKLLRKLDASEDVPLGKGAKKAFNSVTKEVENG